jgi:hypothetical protein
MKMVVVFLVVISLLMPSLALAGTTENDLCESPFGLGRNACCVYNCFEEAGIVARWLAVFTECFSLNSGEALSAASTDGTREVATAPLFGLGPNAWCVYLELYYNEFQLGGFYMFQDCVKNLCFRRIIF